MQALKFTLSGESAFFKKPDVNVKTYFTYNNIHKIALLGLLGAVTGLGGYEKGGKIPEFYAELHDLEVSVVPNSFRGYFSKKIQYFNNSTGYASEEEGGNLQVMEQWLEHPCWTIYIKNNGDVGAELWNRLCTYMLEGKCVYIPYLGKNDHPAVISDVEMVSIEKAEDSNHIDSLFPGELDIIGRTERRLKPFVFTEYAPYAMEEERNFYLFKRFIYTNCALQQSVENTWRYNELVLAFY